MNNPNLSEMINDDDEGALQYLSNLVVVEYEDVKSGYKISFVSSQNKRLVCIVIFVIMGTVNLYSLGMYRRDWITPCACMFVCMTPLVFWVLFSEGVLTF